MSGMFAGKVAWVTGGTRGLGLSVARTLVDEGASVAISSRNEELVRRTASELSPSTLPLPLDVSQPGEVDAAVEGILRAFGKLDLAVTCAGISPVYTRAENIDVEDWRRIIDVNLSGTFFTLRAAARPMLAAHAGAMVAVSSIFGRVGSPRLAAYCASKGGVEQLVRTLALEWIGRGVRLNAVAPGYVETDMTTGLKENEHIYREITAPNPIGRFARPEEVVGAILFLLSESSSYATGASFAIDGGWTAA